MGSLGNRFGSFAKKNLPVIERALRRSVPPASAQPGIVHKAMRYSLFAGGKRLRPLLVLAGCRAVGGKLSEAIPAACAVELLHTYSLIHDDLPCMDDDDLRRGRPTCHKVFGDGIATLAGDGLLTEAFTLLARAYARKPALATALVFELGSASGSLGMVGGQAADLEATGRKGVSPAQLRFIHARKTGALILACLRMGARIGEASARELASISRFGRAVGLAFQIVDDILDVVGDEKTLGKPVGSDERQKKVTYPAVFGLARARKEANAQVEASRKAASAFGRDGELLADLATWIGSRTH